VRVFVRQGYASVGGGKCGLTDHARCVRVRRFPQGRDTRPKCRVKCTQAASRPDVHNVDLRGMAVEPPRDHSIVVAVGALHCDRAVWNTKRPHRHGRVNGDFRRHLQVADRRAEEFDLDPESRKPQHLHSCREGDARFIQ